MDRRELLAHLRKTHFPPGDKKQALRDARHIAAFLKEEYGARVVGIGSLFSARRAFRRDSDIDLVVNGLPAAEFFSASAKAADMTSFSLDLFPLESASPYLRERVEQEGVPL